MDCAYCEDEIDPNDACFSYTCLKGTKKVIYLHGLDYPCMVEWIREQKEEAK